MVRTAKVQTNVKHRIKQNKKPRPKLFKKNRKKEKCMPTYERDVCKQIIFVTKQF